MKLTLSAIAAVALFSLTACQSEPEVLDGRAPDPNAEKIKAAGPVELPPAMTASKSFRCGDNSLVYVDFFAGDKQVNVRTDKDGRPTQLKAPAAGEAYVAEGGWQLTGNQQSIKVTTPGASERSCRA